MAYVLFGGVVISASNVMVVVCEVPSLVRSVEDTVTEASKLELKKGLFTPTLTEVLV